MQDILKNVKLKDITKKDFIINMLKDLSKEPNENSVLVDIADAKLVFEADGVVDAYTAQELGENSIQKALESIVNNIIPKQKLNSVLVWLEISPHFKLKKAAIDIDKYLFNLGDEDTDIIFGSIVNETFYHSHIKINMLVNMVEFDYETAHYYTANNKKYIERSKECGCCYCMTKFLNGDVVEYAGQTTAICPNCGIDSVVCDAIVPITDKLLKDMHKRWFC